MAISRLDRAKQFMAFDALKGLQEAYREKEIIYEERRYLSEETEKEISEKLLMLNAGSLVKIKYYKNRKYETILGVIKKINLVKRKIIMEDETNIFINDIIDVIIL